MNIEGRPTSRLETFTDRVMIFLIALVVSTVPVVVTTDSPASAARACGGTPGNYHDGFYHNPDAYPGYDFEGVSGYIVVRDGVPCSGVSGSANFSNAWVMITPHRGFGEWSQVGFERTSGYPLRWFSQHAWYDTYTSSIRTATRYSTFSIATEVGKRHTFRVLWSYGCECLQAIIDTTVWSNSPFNPFCCGNWSPRPFSPQFSGETGYTQADVPGSSSAHTAFTALGAQRFADDVLVPMPCTMTGVNENPWRWERSASRCDAFDIWTSTP